MLPFVMMRLRHLERERSLQRAGEELAADRVAEVVGDEHDPLEPDGLATASVVSA